MEKLGAALDAIPGRALDALPASARKQIVELRTCVDGFLNSRAAPGTQGAKLVAGTAEHKAARWAEYQDRGGTWTKDRWEKQYATNMTNATSGLSREAAYWVALGGVSASKKTPFTIRQIVIFRGPDSYMGQLKTGKVSLTQQSIIDIKKDAYFVRQGFEVEYVLEKGASKPFLKALTDAGITYRIGSKI